MREYCEKRKVMKQIRKEQKRQNRKVDPIRELKKMSLNDLKFVLYVIES